MATATFWLRSPCVLAAFSLRSVCVMEPHGCHKLIIQLTATNITQIWGKYGATIMQLLCGCTIANCRKLKVTNFGGLTNIRKVEVTNSEGVLAAEQIWLNVIHG